LYSNHKRYSTVELVVEGSSFLWHQIRCIAAVLILIGQKKEEPSIIDDLLNIEKFPCKPQYSMCSENPLVLFDCQYDNNVEWIYDHTEIEKVIKKFQDVWLNHQTQATIIKEMINNLETRLPISVENENETDDNNNNNKRKLTQPYSSLQGKSHNTNYVKFEKRRTAKSLESRVDHYVKKRRLDSEIYEKIAEANDLAQTYFLNKNTESSKD
jgi:tRNA pseudouridine38/39 synthase